MSLRSRVIDYYLDEDNEPNSQIYESVQEIVKSDICAKKGFAHSENISQVLSLLHGAMGMIAKMIDPESKVNFEEEPQLENVRTKLLLEEHANTREVLVNSFFDDEYEQSAKFVKMYCNDDLDQEQISSWESTRPKLMSFLMKTIQLYGEFVMTL